MRTIPFLAFVYSIGPFLFNLPAFLVSRKRPERESWLLPFVHVPAVVLWLGLVTCGYGAQSLGNLVEGFMIGFAGVVGTYLKVFVVDQSLSRHRLTTYCEALVLVALAVLLRSFMPKLPE